MFTMRYIPRGKLLCPESGVDLSLLPPCRTSLAMHIRRVNYQWLVWNNAHLATPTLPEPVNWHGWRLVGGHIDYQWTDGDVVPVELAGLLVDEGTAAMSDIDDAEDCNLEQWHWQWIWGIRWGMNIKLWWTKTLSCDSTCIKVCPDILHYYSITSLSISRLG